MSIFKDMLRSGETLFKNSVALDYDYVPKLVPYREQQQFVMARCVRPLLQGLNGRNLFITGPPGVGKTVGCKHVLQELEEESDEIIPIYINCWQKNTTYKVVVGLCDAIGYKFIQNRKTEDLFEEVKKRINKTAAVFIFDEIDKADDHDFLYMLLEAIYKKSIFLITNDEDWLPHLDQRIKSRLTPEIISFEPYSKEETEGILRERVSYAFHSGIISADAFNLIVDKTHAAQDIRAGLYLLRESGNAAEDESKRTISLQHAEKAVKKLDLFSIKKEEELAEDVQHILKLIKEHPGSKIGEIHKLHTGKYEACGYKTFQRKVKKLKNSKYVVVKKIGGGPEGNTTLLWPAGVDIAAKVEHDATISEFSSPRVEEKKEEKKEEAYTQLTDFSK